MEVGALIAIGCSIALAFVPRKAIFLIFFIGVLYCPVGAGIEVGTLNFPPGRLLAFVGCARLWLRKEFAPLRRIDRIALVFAGAFIASGIFHEGPSQAVILRCGYALDAVGSYFILRSVVQTQKELVRCLSILLVLLVPIACEMLLESRTRNNLFSYLGGVSESHIRKGRIRAQGPFRHAILAGTVAAALLPIAISLLKLNRRIAIVGIIASLAMVGASASSGPILTLGAGMVAMAFWKGRQYIRPVIFSVIGAAVVLQLVMAKPIWFLIARINIVGGSTGWHRSRLIDSAVKYFGEWWFAGTDYTAHWMETSHMGWSQNHMDITNYYIKCGVIGGLPVLLLFLWLLRRCYKEVGSAATWAAKAKPSQALLYWSMGACLFAHNVSMIGVSYYDQSLLVFYAIVGMIASLGDIVRRQRQLENPGRFGKNSPDLGARLRGQESVTAIPVGSERSASNSCLGTRSPTKLYRREVPDSPTNEKGNPTFR